MGDFGAVVDGEFGDVGLGRGEAVIMTKICAQSVRRYEDTQPKG